ncbi:PREDICTED: proto-oncogene FRAT1 [Galeopterus variegatus]|uniref:Proto-oncogene FRAT1 n=1 Tax=Galeopterus variegatus TaxID=482537 RepID=A0ABM0QSW8_GALVR|nr:PREDICTED: proto-oncogene FRAT1 [Galeopterus variegatus]
MLKPDELMHREEGTPSPGGVVGPGDVTHCLQINPSRQDSGSRGCGARLERPAGSGFRVRVRPGPGFGLSRAPGSAAPPASAEAVGPAPPGAVRCALGDRGRVRGRAAPYCVAELAAGSSALSPLSPQPGFDGPPGAGQRGVPQPLSGPCRRGWLRGAASSRRLQQRRGSQPETRTGDDDPHRLLQQLVLSGNLIKEAVRRLHSRRLQLHAKFPQRPLLGPLSAPVHEPLSPLSPRAACSDPGASGRAQLRPGDGVLVPGS